MGKSSKADLPWRLQWHVTADGTVIHERSRGDQRHRQLFKTYTTTRPVTVAELDALSVRSDREMRRFNPWFIAIAVYILGFAAAGGWVTEVVFGSLLPGLLFGVVAAGAAVPLVVRLLMVVVPKDTVGSVERLWLEAGLTSMNGDTMKAAEARRLIDTPGTTSGVETRVARA